MYKVYIEDAYQIDDILTFCAYHGFKFDETEEWEFLKIFPTKEEADKFIKDCPLLQEDEYGDLSWLPFVVHIEDNTIIDIDGYPFPSELKHYLVEYPDSFKSFDTREEFPENMFNYLDYYEYRKEQDERV